MKLRIEKIKVHFRENKKTYVASGTALALGIIGTLVVKSDFKVSAIIIGKHNTLTQTTILTRRGHPGNVVRCVETGVIFASQKQAADYMGINQGTLSSHLSGKYDNAGGYHFENLGEAQ